MALPHPDVLSQEVKEIEESLRQLVSDYRWVHSLAYGIRTGQPDSSDVKLGKQQTHGPGKTKEGMSWSDPTGQQAIGRGEIRSSMGRVYGRLKGVKEHLEKAHEALSAVLGGRGPDDAYESTYMCSNCQNMTHGPRGQVGDECGRCKTGELKDITKSPMVSDSDLELARDAQRRRHAAGGGYGES